MQLNGRHKAILFLTLVVTGCALLLDAEIKATLGFLILGIAFALAVGSETASRISASLKKNSGTVFSWLRAPLVMALAGAWLGAALLVSHGNPAVGVAAMCLAGAFVEPYIALPTQKLWIRIPLIILAGSAFFCSEGAVLLTASATSPEYGERIGEATVPAFLAFIIGIVWLSKGRALIQRGITAQLETVFAPQLKTRTWTQYVSLFVGLAVLTTWLSLLTWIEFGASTYAPDKVPVPNKNGNNLLLQAGFIVLLARWPYGAWKAILDRESNSNPRYLGRHKGVSALAGMIFVLVLALAVTLGIQNGNDRLLTDRIEAKVTELKTVATKMGAIKQRDLQTTQDYIQAYSEIEVLLPEYESKIKDFDDVVQESEVRDRARGAINIQRLYKTHRPAVQQNVRAIVSALYDTASLTRQEVKTTRTMASFPASRQPDFWKSDFRPLLVQEDSLREKIAALQAKEVDLLK